MDVSPDGKKFDLVTVLGDPTPKECSTRVAVSFDREFLYIDFKCHDENSDIIVTPRIWDGNTVEVFISPDVICPEKYIQVAILPTGRIMLFNESEYIISIDEIKHKVVKDRDGWHATISIPMSSAGIEINRPFRMNLYRHYFSGDTSLRSCWSPTVIDDPHYYSRFGTITLIN